MQMVAETTAQAWRGRRGQPRRSGGFEGGARCCEEAQAGGWEGGVRGRQRRGAWRGACGARLAAEQQGGKRGDQRVSGRQMGGRDGFDRM